jgi:hypothetical protein
LPALKEFYSLSNPGVYTLKQESRRWSTKFCKYINPC